MNKIIPHDVNSGLGLIQPVNLGILKANAEVDAMRIIHPVSGATPEIYEGRTGFRSYHGPKMFVVQKHGSKPINRGITGPRYDNMAHSLGDDVRQAIRRAAMPLAAGLLLYCTTNAEGADFAKLAPSRGFVSLTTTTDFTDGFLDDAQKAGEEQSAQIAAMLGSPDTIDVRTFKDKARQLELVTPGFGLEFDVSKRWTIIFEGSYGKGDLKTRGTSDETHLIPAMPDFNTGPFNYHVEVQRQSLTFGAGAIYHLFRGKPVDVYLLGVVGPQFAGYRANADIRLQGVPGIVPPSEIKLNDKASDWGIFAAGGIGTRLNISSRLSVDVTARYNQVESTKDVSRDLSSFGIGVAFMYELQKPDTPRPSLMRWIKGKF